MTRIKLFALLFSITFLSFQSIAQDDVKVEVVKLTDNIYKLVSTTNLEVNLLAFTGPDGVLLVDDGQGGASEKIMEAIRKFSKGEIKYVINTHFHLDHTGGNQFFGKTATIIGHKNVRHRMTGGISILLETPDEALPTLIVDSEITLHYNGEEIRVIHLSGGHTDGDLIVHFTKSNIVAMGDLLFSDRFPFVDTNNSGNLHIYAKNIKKAYSMFTEDTKFIAGHGREYSVADMKNYYKLMTETAELVKKGLDNGRTADEMKKSKILEKWSEWGTGFITQDTWIDAIVTSYSTKEAIELESVVVPLFFTMKEKNIKAAVLQFHELKKTHSKEYNFSEAHLNFFGYYLLGKERFTDAIEIFKLNVEENPGSSNVYDSLGEGYMMNGDIKLAKKNYNLSLKLNPNNQNAKDMLKKLKKM